MSHMESFRQRHLGVEMRTAEDLRQALKTSGRLLKERDDCGNSLLHLAVLSKACDKIRVILAALKKTKQLKSFLTQPNHSGETPLYIALKQGNAGIVSTLLRVLGPLKETVLKGTGNDSLFLLHRLIKCKDFKGVDVLFSVLDSSKAFLKELLQQSDKQSCTALHVMAGVVGVSSDLMMDALVALEDQAETVLKQMDSDGNTVLHIAIRENQADIVDIILRVLDDQAIYALQQWNYYNDTALHIAAMRGHLEIIKRCLQVLDHLVLEVLQMENCGNQTPLHLAMKHASSKGMQVFLEALGDQAAEILTKGFGKSNMSLIESALPSVLKDKLSFQDVGFKIEKQSIDHLITYLKFLEPKEAKKILLRENNAGETLLSIIAMEGDPDVFLTCLDALGHQVRRILKPTSDDSLVLKMIKEQKIRILGICLPFLSVRLSKMVLKKKDFDGNTPLHMAVHQRDLEIADLFLTTLGEHAKDILEVRNNEGNTPFHLAIPQDDAEMINLFLGVLDSDDGRILHICNREGNTLLHLAARENNAKIMKICLGALGIQAKGVLQMPNRFNVTAIDILIDYTSDMLMMCLKYFDPSEVKMMLRRQDVNGNTLLHRALMEVNVPLVRMLLHHFSQEIAGGVMTYANRSGLTPVSLAINMPSSVREYMKRIAKPSLKDRIDKTVFHFKAWVGLKIKALSILETRN